MNNGNLVIKKCNHCGKLIEELDSKNTDTICCGESMQYLNCNSTDGAAEKHVPKYDVLEGRITATVNHPMDEDHYIMWIKFVYANGEKTFFFKPGDEIEADSRYEAGMKIYAYCNLHGLWVREVV